MLKILPQIMATILSIGTTFIIGYFIYLYSYRSNIDYKIEEEGERVIHSLNNLELPMGNFWYSSARLYNQYQKIYNNKSNIEILALATHDVSSLIPFNDQNFVHDKTKNIFDSTTVKGRIDIVKYYFYIVYKCIAILNRVDIGFATYRLDFDKEEYEKDHSHYDIFPHGLVGIEGWLLDFYKIDNIQQMLYGSSYSIGDYIWNGTDTGADEAVAGLDFYREINYKNVADSFHSVFFNTRNHVNRLNSLMCARDSFSIKSKLPNRWWILASGSLSFLVGVIAPLLIIGYSDNIPVPTSINYSLLFCSFIFLFTALLLVYQDTSSSKNKDFNSLVSYNLRRHLPKQRNELLGKIYIDTTFYNDILKETEYKSLPKNISLNLSKYNELLLDINSSSLSLVDDIAKAFQALFSLNKYVDKDSQYHSYNVLSLIMDNKRIISFPKDALCLLQYNEFNTTYNIIWFRTPNDDVGVEKINNKLNAIINEFRENPKYTNCISNRHKAIQLTGTLLEEI